MSKEKLQKAENFLHASYNEVIGTDEKIHSDFDVFLEMILTGNHKTYRYILFTALLAKATFGEDISALSLQKEYKGKGAYDARSLAHKVVVPFEGEFLNGALGASNEPYLNKPARFPALSKENAVRAGQDKQKLDLLVDVLGGISKEQAIVMLKKSLQILIEVGEKNNDKYKIDSTNDSSLLKTKNMLSDLLSEKHGGETLAILIGTLLKIYSNSHELGYKVEVHKVNQSGASSKEIGDIDVYDGSVLVFSVEAKDKPFTLQDVEHSLKKSLSAGLDKSIFVYGNSINISEDLHSSVKGLAEKHDNLLAFSSFNEFSTFMLLLSNKSSVLDLPRILLETAKESLASDSTVTYLKRFIKDTLETDN
ncbi:restriction endonuclease, SacI family [Ligilactobacillus murinus]|uniref:restriction endonuclease, SacI family n=1 Tax=Ligilactobacillus murinus TaxID=1622 RepID=UPI003516477A